MIKSRLSSQRGFAQHGWLKSHHTFSFADYHDPKQMGFGALRVINEDWIAASKGFGAHPHQNMEIITYVVAGSLAHEDSLGHKAIVRPNEIQRMTAGTGIVHAEINPEASQATHLLQIWIEPAVKGLRPSYEQRSFAAQLASGKPVLVVSPDGRGGSVSINQDVNLYIARLRGGGQASFRLAPQRAAWVQVIAGTVTANGAELQAGDAAAVTGEDTLSLVAAASAEFMVFDLLAR